MPHPEEGGTFWEPADFRRKACENVRGCQTMILKRGLKSGELENPGNEFLKSQLRCGPQWVCLCGSSFPVQSDPLWRLLCPVTLALSARRRRISPSSNTDMRQQSSSGTTRTSASVYTNIGSLCRTTETNVVSYANYTSNKINKMRTSVFIHWTLRNHYFDDQKWSNIVSFICFHLKVSIHPLKENKNMNYKLRSLLQHWK